jgi:hypothetical protein
MSGLVCSGALLMALSVGADPVVGPPTLPPPREQAAPLGSLPPGIGFYRPNPYDVWQPYAPDRSGHWRPRVILVPGDMAFRMIDGKPYPYAYAYPNYFMPYAD